jgi:prepilin-type N-terminal cleavage/methylation domain-containing protein
MGKHGLTLIELICVLLLLSVLTLVLGRLSGFQLAVWEQGYERQSAQARMSQAMDRSLRSLRHAQSIDDFTESSISFSADLGAGIRSYRIYLYHPDDGAPNPPYTQTHYELRAAEGDLTYGKGTVLNTGIKVSEGPVFVRNTDLISIDLTAEYGDVTTRGRSHVQLRNL